MLNRLTAPQLNEEPNLTEPAKVTHRLTHWYYVKKWRQEVEDNFHDHNFYVSGESAALRFGNPKECSLLQVDVMLLICPARTLWRMASTLPTLVTNLRIGYSSVRKAPFVLHSHLQIPQSDLGTIPATCLLKDA